MFADRVLGVGSPHGDDAAGWRVVEMLRRRPGLSARLAIVEPTVSLVLRLTEGRDLETRADPLNVRGSPPSSLTASTWIFLTLAEST